MIGAGGTYLRAVFASRLLVTCFPLLNSAAVVKNPPNNLWIIGCRAGTHRMVTVIIIIITAVLCRKNKNDFKPDTVMNLPQRARYVSEAERRG